MNLQAKTGMASSLVIASSQVFEGTVLSDAVA